MRAATLSDIPAMLELGKRFADDAGVTEWVGWDEANVTALLTFLIEDENGICLVADGAMIGGFVSPHPFNNAVKTFQELFWRSEGGGGVGIRLLKLAESIATAKGATRSIMIGMDNLPDTDRLYARMGYKPLEKLHIKRL